MPNGTHGDDPLLDIVSYKLDALTAPVDQLIAEVVALGGTDELRERFGFSLYYPPESAPASFEEDLRLIRDRLEHDGREAGWDVDSLLDDARRGRGSA
jgi:hypothetical protein